MSKRASTTARRTGPVTTSAVSGEAAPSSGCCGGGGVTGWASLSRGNGAGAPGARREDARVPWADANPPGTVASMGKSAKDPAPIRRDLPADAAGGTLPATTSGDRATREGYGVPGQGLSLAAVLELPCLAGAEVLAGRSGLSGVVSRLNVMEVPDILPWVKPQELLLTTGYPLRAVPESLTALVGQLAGRGLAGLAVKRGRYLHELPPAMLEEADRLGLPIIGLPDAVSFDDVINQVLTEVLNRQAAVLARSEEAHRALVQIVLTGGGLDRLCEELVGICGGAAMVTTPDGRVLASAGGLEQVEHLGCFDGSGRFIVEAEPVGSASRRRPGLHPRRRPHRGRLRSTTDASSRSPPSGR